MARLRITSAEGSRELALGERLTIGRVEGDLVLDDKGCSRRHCEIVKGPSGYLVRDLGSSNGTSVNGEKITERALVDGDKIRVGAVQLNFLASDADCALRFTSGEHAGRELPLAAARTTLGRRADNALAFNDVKVSGVHLEIVREGDGFVLRDLGSTNGTFLDGRKVTEVALGHGDKVKFGESEFQFVDLRKGDAAASAQEGIGGTEGPVLAKTLQVPEKKGKAAAVVGLLAIVLAVGGAAAWYFLYAQGDRAPTSGRRAPPAPEGTLLNEDWSFEEAATAAALWTAELGDGFAPRRGKAASGSFAFGATVADGATTCSVRQAETFPKSRSLLFRGQLAADAGVLASAGLRFVPAADAATGSSALTVVAARAQESDFTPFEMNITAPPWAEGVEVVVTARGNGSAWIDDLALLPGDAARAGKSLGELSLLSRGGGAYCLDHRAPLVELFTPWGSAAGEGGVRVELPPGAFAAEIKDEGNVLHLKAPAGPFAPEAFSALVMPDVAAAGVTLLMARGSVQRFGAFETTEAKSLLLGSAAERVELEFKPPARIAAIARGDALELRVAPAAGGLAVSLRSNFEAERKEASDLLAGAQEDARNDRIGAALTKLNDLRNRLPYDEKTVELSRKLDADLIPRLTSELSAVEAEAAAAEFLGSFERYQKALTRARALLAQTEGLDATKELAALVEKLETTTAGMERERREQEARRLLSLARAYQTFSEQYAAKNPGLDRKATADELLAELQKTYADTAAAKEARGESPPEPRPAPERASGPAAGASDTGEPRGN